MGSYFEVARAAIERHGGTVEKFIGDAVMAVFGVPTVREDDALRAVRAAEELRDAVEIEVRIGVNTGEVVTGSADKLVTGDAVNVAARLEQAAGTGDVLLGETTYRLVREAVDAELLPPLQAKGKSEPLTAYRLRAVTGDVGVARRQDAALVGRRPREADARRRLGADGLRERLLPVHDPRHPGRRQVSADCRVPRRARRHGGPGALPPIWRRDHLLARRGGREAAPRRRGSSRCDRRAPRGRAGLRRRDRRGGSEAVRSAGVGTPPRRPFRRPPVGRTDLPRPRRARGRLVARRADPPALRRPPRAARAASRVGRRQAECDDRPARAAFRRRRPTS